MKSILQISEDGKTVQVPPSIRARIPKDAPMPVPRVLKMLRTNKAIAASQFGALSVAYILPMVVHASPIITLLTTVEDKMEFKPRYASVFDSYAQLGQLRIAICNGLILKLDVTLVKEAEAKCIEEGTNSQIVLMRDIEHIDNVTDFLIRLEKHTIETLNRFERMIHRCLIGDKNIPQEMCLTPFDTPHLSVLPPMDTERYWDVFINYWDTKVQLINHELERDSNTTPTQWITVEGLRTAHEHISPDQLWRGYLTPKTASEYMAYFKLE